MFAEELHLQRNVDLCSNKMGMVEEEEWFRSRDWSGEKYLRRDSMVILKNHEFLVHDRPKFALYLVQWRLDLLLVVLSFLWNHYSQPVSYSVWGICCPVFYFKILGISLRFLVYIWDIMFSLYFVISFCCGGDPSTPSPLYILRYNFFQIFCFCYMLLSIYSC